jgi:type IV secretion system protein VirB9
MILKRVYKVYLNFKVIILAIFSIIIISNPVYALRESKPTSIDNRIRVMVYNPDDVHKYTGYYGYSAYIEFADGETIDNVSMGDSLSWQIVPSGKRLFLKPMEQDATTNMTVITNQRTYFFELHAKEAEDINDPEMVFTVRFLYPDDGIGESIKHFTGNSEPDLSEPEKYNFNYTISGKDTISPIKIFDDGEFTYFQFKDKNAAIPAFFIVDPQGHEEIVNYRMAGRYVVVERVVERFSLRYGKEYLCVFNESTTFEDYE